LLLIFVGTGFEVLSVVRTDIAVWLRTLCSLVYAYESFGGAFYVCFHKQLEDGGSMC
jgi:hypothetical protein